MGSRIPPCEVCGRDLRWKKGSLTGPSRMIVRRKGKKTLGFCDEHIREYAERLKQYAD